MWRYRLIILEELPFMTQVVLMKKQTLDQSSVLLGSEGKHLLSQNDEGSWVDIAGLSWLIIEDQAKYEMDAI